MARKVPDEVQKVFDKYTPNFVRRLNKDKAKDMFQTEFKMDEETSELMFEMFDNDKNNILSIWEFNHFYASFGYDINKYLEQFKELEEDGTGNLDISKTWDFLATVQTMSGRHLTEEELETNMKGKMMEDKHVNKKKYLELISRIRLTRN